MVDALAVIRPGVLMRIELHHGEWPMDGGVGLEHRPGHEVIAAERKQEGA
jgi:hypothetical protein